MNVYVWNRLPSTYQEVEYIQSTGTEWINSWVKPTNKTKVVHKWYLTWWTFYWVWLAWSYYSIMLYNWDGTHYRSRCRSSSSWNSTVDSSVTCNTTPHVFECSQVDGLYIDWTKIWTFTQYTYTETKDLYLFAWDNYRDNIADWKENWVTIYYMKIYEDWTLIRDYVPCYRKSDSVIWLYDLVNNQFYTNSWTGTFSKWSDVVLNELQNAYIGNWLS